MSSSEPSAEPTGLQRWTESWTGFLQGIQTGGWGMSSLKLDAHFKSMCSSSLPLMCPNNGRTRPLGAHEESRSAPGYPAPSGAEGDGHRKVGCLPFRPQGCGQCGCLPSVGALPARVRSDADMQWEPACLGLRRGRRRWCWESGAHTGSPGEAASRLPRAASGVFEVGAPMPSRPNFPGR